MVLKNFFLTCFRENRIISLTVIIPFILRALFSFDNSKLLIIDIKTYDAFGMNILKHGVMYNSTSLAPGYTYFLASIYWLFGHNLLYVYFIQSILGAGITLLIYLIADNIFGRRVSTASAVLSLFYWPLTLYSGILLSETLFMFCLLLGVYLFFKGMELEKTSYMALCGFMFALSALTRSITLLLIFLIPLEVYFLKRENIRWVLKSSIIYMGIFIIALTPWIVRNYMLYNTIIPVDSLSGINLYIGNNEKSDGTFMDLSKDPLYNPDEDIYKTDRKLKQAGIDYIIKHPGRFLKITMKRMFLFLKMDFYEFDWVLKTYMKENILLMNNYVMWVMFMKYSDIGFFLIGVMGLGALIKKNKGAVMLSFMLYFFLITSVFVVQFRYRLPVIPFLSISAALGCVKFVDWIKRIKTKTT